MQVPGPYPRPSETDSGAWGLGISGMTEAPGILGHRHFKPSGQSQSWKVVYYQGVTSFP